MRAVKAGASVLWHKFGIAWRREAAIGAPKIMQDWWNGAIMGMAGNGEIEIFETFGYVIAE